MSKQRKKWAVAINDEEGEMKPKAQPEAETALPQIVSDHNDIELNVKPEQPAGFSEQP